MFLFLKPFATFTLHVREKLARRERKLNYKKKAVKLREGFRNAAMVWSSYAVPTKRIGMSLKTPWSESACCLRSKFWLPYNINPLKWDVSKFYFQILFPYFFGKITGPCTVYCLRSRTIFVSMKWLPLSTICNTHKRWSGDSTESLADYRTRGLGSEPRLHLHLERRVTTGSQNVTLIKPQCSNTDAWQIVQLNNFPAMVALQMRETAWLDGGVWGPGTPNFGWSGSLLLCPSPAFTGITWDYLLTGRLAAILTDIED